MIKTARQQYNADFTVEKYHTFLDEIEQTYHHRPPFRIAETPVFVNNDLKQKLLDASERICQVITQSDFKEKSKAALPTNQIVPNETDHTTFMSMDFGICKGPDGTLHPYLIEVQGFPSLYFYQHVVANLYKKHFTVPDDYTYLFNQMQEEEYIELLKRVIVGNSKVENVILLEVEPEKQATFIDFAIGKQILGVEYVCVKDLKVVGKDVYYEKGGKLIQVEKIYNRVIFDELIKRDDIKRDFYFVNEYNVDWIGHPNWFFRISKHTLPFLSDIPYVPETKFLSDFERIPENLQDYVLKPLFSFSGTGVLINPTLQDVEAVTNPEEYILQRKVQYEPIIETPNVPSKCEIRMLMIWEDGEASPKIVNNLARLSKGEMIGVKYNKNKDWVGGSVGFFEAE